MSDNVVSWITFKWNSSGPSLPRRQKKSKRTVLERRELALSASFFFCTVSEQTKRTRCFHAGGREGETASERTQGVAGGLRASPDAQIGNVLATKNTSVEGRDGPPGHGTQEEIAHSAQIAKACVAATVR